MNTTEAEIVKSLREGDIKAFGEAFHQHYPKLIVTAIKLVLDTQVAVDMVQGVFLQIWERRDRLELRSSFHAYLQQSVRNASLNYLKQESIRDHHHKNYSLAIAEMNTAGFSTEPEEKFIEKELLEQLHGAIQKLPEKCRTVFELSRLSGKTNKEIATILNLSIRTVETQIYLALKTIRKELDRHLDG